MCCLGVAWVKSIAQVLSPRPRFSLDPKLSTYRDSILILQVKTPYSSLSSYNIYQYHTMCSKQGKPSVSVHLTLMPSSSVGRNSDPFLGLPVPLLVPLEHSTSAWRKCQPEKLPQKMVLRYNEFGIVRTHWSLKAKVTVMDNIPPDSHPINRMRIGRFSAPPSCSLINWRNRLDSVASHATRHSEDHTGHRKCWRKIGETLRSQICWEIKQRWTR